MNGIVRRRVMNKPKEKGPIINTYKVSGSVTASTSSAEKRWWSTFTWNLGATYTFDIKFNQWCTYVRVYLSNSSITVGNTSGPTGILTWLCNEIPSVNNIHAMIWKPTADGTITINITESIPRT